MLLLGVGLLYSSWRVVDLILPLTLLVYFHLAVVWFEEPELRRGFGSKYEDYCKRVPRWFPVPASPAHAAQQGDAAGGASRRR
jgi:protein-S-isoprenylcysteine O-methyltransferase Ste14